MELVMGASEKLAIIAAGLYFLIGLLTGIWKYQQMMASENGEAHYYVNITHRAALLYAFAALLLAKFCEISRLPEHVELIAVAVVLFYFLSAILIYLVHGLVKDTENQMAKPHKMAGREVSSGFVRVLMWTLIAGEVGGFLVIFYGVIQALL